ncbi:ROK family protein [Paenibacillus sp. EC2-1]|uniref:ROK family protein n=1 Tax=Paenibacillus sp. EC2-1 TaxID=3388665 RepID=UPI003BEEFC29
MLKQFQDFTSPRMTSLKKLYELIRLHGPIGITGLVEITGYKPSTCSRLLDELIHSGVIMDSGLGQSSGGRKPVIYVINPNSHYVIGIDISPLHITYTLLNLSLDVLEKDLLKINESTISEDIIQFLCSRINASISNYDIQDSQLLGIGIGDNSLEIQYNGYMDTDITSDIHHSFRTIYFSEIQQQLEDTYNVLVRSEKGINLAALGEYRKLYKNVSKNLVYTLCGVEIKSGIIIQGNLYEQKHAIQNTLGHTVIDVHGKKCYCGKFGCLATYSSIPAIREEIIRQLKRSKPSLLNQMVQDIEYINTENILEAIRQGDPLCHSIVEDAAFYYGIGLSNLINLLLPDIVVIGGMLSMESVFYEKVVETIQHNTVQNHSYEIQIVRTTSGYNSIAIGAASLILDYYGV